MRRFIKKDLAEPCGKILADLDFSTAVFTGIQSIEHTWSELKRKVAGCVHLYGSVSQALDAVLEGS